MDKYTKFVLTMIAVALFGINFHLFSGNIISSAEAIKTKEFFGKELTSSSLLF